MANYRNSLKAGSDRDRGVSRKAATGPVPRWDAERRELWWGDLLLKRFAKSAPNQERLLSAFQAAGWPHFLEDPLPVTPGIDRHDRLKETCKQLNETILPGYLKFGCDGARGASWRREALPAKKKSPKISPARRRKPRKT